MSKIVELINLRFGIEDGEKLRYISGEPCISKVKRHLTALQLAVAVQSSFIEAVAASRSLLETTLTTPPKESRKRYPSDFPPPPEEVALNNAIRSLTKEQLQKILEAVK